MLHGCYETNFMLDINFGFVPFWSCAMSNMFL